MSVREAVHRCPWCGKNRPADEDPQPGKGEAWMCRLCGGRRRRYTDVHGAPQEMERDRSPEKATA